MASISFFLIAAFGLVGRSVVGQSGSTGASCSIPDGQFDGMIVDTNTIEPFYGSRCVLSSASVQVRKWMCIPYYCCEQPCTCSNPTVNTQFQKCANGSVPQTLSCFVIKIEMEESLWGCCNGSQEDTFGVCTSAIDCKVSNGGCDQLCQHNAISGQDYCDCYPGNQRRLLNSNGTTKCIGNGPIPSSTITTTLTVASTPAVGAISSGPSGFPVPYIIAIAVALFLFLLLILLLLLLLLCCRKRRTEEKKSVFVISSNEIKIPPIKDFKDIESGKKNLYDYDDDKVKIATTGDDVKYRRENQYSEDPVAAKGLGENANGRGQGQVSDEGLKPYESLNFINKVESDDGTYEEIKGYANDDEHPDQPVE